MESFRLEGERGGALIDRILDVEQILCYAYSINAICFVEDRESSDRVNNVGG